MAELHLVSRERSEECIGDVIFVHGLDGDHRATWQIRDQPKTYWPAWLADDLPGVCVWSLGYQVSSSEFKGETMPLFDRATNVLAKLAGRKIGERPIVFVTHSMGGLLIKQVLRNAESGRSAWKTILDNTKGVAFLSTPHTGADMANVARFLPITESVRELLPNAASLRDLNTWYRKKASDQNIKALVLVEKRKTRLFQRIRFIEVLIVDPATADPGIHEVTPVGIDADHYSISRPLSSDDLVYTETLAFARECFGQLSKKAQVEGEPQNPHSVIEPIIAETRIEVATLRSDVFQAAMPPAFIDLDNLPPADLKAFEDWKTVVTEEAKQKFDSQYSEAVLLSVFSDWKLLPKELEEVRTETLQFTKRVSELSHIEESLALDLENEPTENQVSDRIKRWADDLRNAANVLEIILVGSPNRLSSSDTTLYVRWGRLNRMLAQLVKATEPPESELQKVRSRLVVLRTTTDEAITNLSMAQDRLRRRNELLDTYINYTSTKDYNKIEDATIKAYERVKAALKDFTNAGLLYAEVSKRLIEERIGNHREMGQ